MSELLQCPFCGGNAQVITPDDGLPYVMCISRYCTAPKETVAKAIAAWNTRAPDAAYSAGWKAAMEAEVDVDEIASAMWREEAVDSGTPASIAKGRTRSAFDDQSDWIKRKWRKSAIAAIAALRGMKEG